MKKKCLIFTLLFSLFSLCACGESSQSVLNPSLNGIGEEIGDSSESFGESLEGGAAYDGYFEGDINEVTVTCVSGTQNAYSIEGNTVTFTEISEESIYSISGKLKGNIVINVGDSYKFELELSGISLISDTVNPITVLSGDEVKLTAKKDTENYIYDERDDVSLDETLYSGAIHSEVDTEIAGKGSLTVISKNNNGIHTKDDLQLKNLTLLVSCTDNALKGNDSVEIKSGNITLIATKGDGIKTKNSDISKKGNQRGNVIILAGTVTVYSARDGIDAAYNVEINDEAELKIYTDKYSSYTQSDETGSFVNDDETMSISLMKGPPGGMGTRPPDRPGNMWGQGGMQDGNTDKAEYSSKGIKAANEITLLGGNIVVKSYDDSIHSSNESALENEENALGNVTVDGANLTLYSDDDAIHADGAVMISDGSIYVVSSYEGIEGASVTVSGGYVSVAASDDGINSTAVSGDGIVLCGGRLYVFSGGDGIDSNSRTAYSGIRFSGTDVVIISTSGGNSAIDTEAGYAYTCGAVIAIMPRGAMTNEAKHTSSFNSVGVMTSVSVEAGECLSADIDGRIITVKLPCSMSGTAVILGASGADVTVESSYLGDVDVSGVNWGD